MASSSSILSVTAKAAALGDMVVLYASPENMWSVRLTAGSIHNCGYGSFEHNKIVGTAFGSKIAPKNNDDGWLYLLRPTPELWTGTLGHRTQIVFTRDISMILLQLDLRNGSLVVESGTGSGSLTASLVCAVAPMGHVYTFEYHQERAELARKDFERLGLTPYVDVAHRDAVADGFAIAGDAAKQAHWADAVFLDLPNPSAAVANAGRALKPGAGRLCTFSPCIEQVQATCEALRAAEFHSIKTIECLVQPMMLTKPTFDTITVPVQLPKKARTDRYELVRQQQDIRGHTSYLTFASAPQKAGEAAAACEASTATATAATETNEATSTTSTTSAAAESTSVGAGAENTK